MPNLSGIEELFISYTETIGVSVIPIAHQSKKPLISWAEYQERIATSEEIHQWVTQWPDCGIAMITGKISNVIVLDIDPRNGGIDEVLWQQYPTWRALTGGGGVHYFFTYEEIPTTLSPGYDLKSDGGYVIIPPSIHPNGATYTWDRSPYDHELLTLHDSIRHRIDTAASEPDAPLFSTDHAIVGMIPTGDRNATLTSMAGTFRRKGYTEPEILASLKIINTSRCNPPLTDKELSTIAKSVARYEPEDPIPTNNDTPTTFQALTVKEILDSETPSVEWIVDGIIPRRAVVSIGAETGSYKSWVALAVATSVVLGEPLFDAFDTEQGSILMFDMENDRSVLKERLTAFGINEFTEEQANRFNYLNTDTSGELIDLSNNDQLDTFIQFAQSVNPDLMILDTFVNFHTLNENDASQMKMVNVAFRKILKHLPNASILYLSHHRKPNKDRDQGIGLINKLRGSSAIGGEVTHSFAFAVEEVTRRINVYAAKQRMHHPDHGDIKPFQIQLVPDPAFPEAPYRRTFQYIGSENPAFQTGKTSETLDAVYSLVENAHPTPTLRSTILETLEALGYAEITVKRAIKKLIDDTAITKVEVPGQGNPTAYIVSPDDFKPF